MYNQALSNRAIVYQFLWHIAFAFKIMKTAHVVSCFWVLCLYIIYKTLYVLTKD